MEQSRKSLRMRVGAVLTAGFLMVGMTGAATAATSRVRVRGEKWRPVHKYVGRGTKVVWKNTSNIVHDIRAMRKWRLSEVLSPREKVSKKFRKRGTFPYRCVRHSAIVGGKCKGMCGFIHVS